MDVNGFIINPQSGSAGVYDIDFSVAAVNEGIDKEVIVEGVCGDKSAPLHLVHEGLRQPFGLNGGGVFRIKNGGRFGVLKVGEPIVPPTPVETYTRLTYIECDGQQCINTGYVVQEDDIIKCYYDCNVLTKKDKFLFCTYDSKAVWLSIYNYTAYTRFGSGTSTTINYASRNHYVEVRKESVTFDVTETTLPYEEMPATPLFVFARRSTSGSVDAHFVGRCTMFKISNANGDVIELRPVKRDRDGKIGMLDVISGNFFASEGDADFIGGNEVRITEGYEIIDRVYFNKNKAFNTGYYGNNTTSIDVMFQRTSTSAAAYLFGLTQGNRLTGYLSSGSAYWRYGNAYPTFATATLKIYKGVVTPGKTTVDDTSKTFTVNEFTTSDPIPVGGYKSGTNPITKHYIGYIYYFRMWHGDTLLIDWYPCKRLSDGVEGFWDCVSQTFIEPI